MISIEKFVNCSRNVYKIKTATWIDLIGEEGVDGGGAPFTSLIKIGQHHSMYVTYELVVPEVMVTPELLMCPHQLKIQTSTGLLLAPARVYLSICSRASVSVFSLFLFALSSDFMIWKMNRRISCFVVRWMGFQTINSSMQHALHTVDTRW